MNENENRVQTLAQDIVNEIIYGCDRFDRNDLREIIEIEDIDIQSLRHQTFCYLTDQYTRDLWNEKQLDYWFEPFDRSVILAYWKGIRKLTKDNPHTKQYYDYLIGSSQRIDRITPLSGIFTKDEIRAIRKMVRPKKKECYRNASKFACDYNAHGGHYVEYVEGMMTVCHAIPIAHAWNRIDGKYWVDITAELLNLGVSGEEYRAMGVFSPEEVRSSMLKHKVYGEVFRDFYMENIKEK